MNLRTWRQQNHLTLDRAAEMLGLSGANRRSLLRRYERGEHQIGASLAETILTATDGQVTLQDLHEQRKAWIESKRMGASS
jgi:transcriptional regulator with XRE-family HTH domain